MSSLRIFLRPGEKVFLNGAVLRADRKVSLEVLNDVSFMLESHVLQAEETTTPLRQLYFLIQAILINPAEAEQARSLYREFYEALSEAVSNSQLKLGLAAIDVSMSQERTFEALKLIRQLYPVEEEILKGGAAPVHALQQEAV
jgi:flagellar protein FlbT